MEKSNHSPVPYHAVALRMYLFCLGRPLENSHCLEAGYSQKIFELVEFGSSALCCCCPSLSSVLVLLRIEKGLKVHATFSHVHSFAVLHLMEHFLSSVNLFPCL